MSFWQVDMVFGNAAPQRRDIRGVEGGVAGVAAEHAEDADPLVRAHGGALPLDGIDSAGDRGGEADAVFRVTHVVVHGLGHGHDRRAPPGELGRVAEGVVTADGDEVIQAEGLDVLLDRARDVVRDTPARGGRGGKVLTREHGRQLGHAGRAGARRVQVGAAGAIDGASILPVERKHVARAARGILEIDVGQSFPAATQPDHGISKLAATVHHRFDHGVQAGHIAATRENTDLLPRHGSLLRHHRW